MSARRTLKQKVHHVLNDEHSRWFFPINNLIAIIIVVSTTVVILETVPDYFTKYHYYFILAEYAFLSIFAAEYALRIWSAPNPFRYMTSFFGIVDLLSVLPGIFILLTPNAITYHTLGIIRILRVLRLLRTFRLATLVIPKRHRERVAKEIHNGQSFINLEIYLFALATIVVFSGTLMYVVEGHIPGTHFHSIPEGLWWAIVTISTVGYGDTVPITALGRMVATVTMIAGLGLFVLMLTVVGRIMQLILFGTAIEEKSN